MLANNLQRLAFMFLLTYNFDLLRQSFFQTRVSAINLSRKLKHLGLPDYSRLPLGSKLLVAVYLGPDFVKREEED